MTMLALLSGLLLSSGLLVQPIPKRVVADSVRSEWRVLNCDACKAANITVESRRSKSTTGEAGEYLVVRVRNANTHGVVVDLALHEGPQSRDVDGLPTTHQRIQTVLHPSGTAQAEHEVVVWVSSIRQIVVHGVERW